MLMKGKVIFWQIKQMIWHIQNGYVNYSYSIYSQISKKGNIQSIQKNLRDIIKTLCGYKGVEIIEGKLPDHVHILVSIPPKYSISQFMGYLKGKVH